VVVVVVDVGVAVGRVVVLVAYTGIVVLVEGSVVVLGGAGVVVDGGQRHLASQASPSRVFPSSHSSLPVRSPLPHTVTVQSVPPARQQGWQAPRRTTRHVRRPVAKA
jgi:hypothetical protein